MQKIEKFWKFSKKFQKSQILRKMPKNLDFSESGIFEIFWKFSKFFDFLHLIKMPLEFVLRKIIARIFFYWLSPFFGVSKNCVISDHTCTRNTHMQELYTLYAQNLYSDTKNDISIPYHPSQKHKGKYRKKKLQKTRIFFWAKTWALNLSNALSHVVIWRLRIVLAQSAEFVQIPRILSEKKGTL